MCFSRSLKGENPESNNEFQARPVSDNTRPEPLKSAMPQHFYAPPAGPPPNSQNNNPYAAALGQSRNQDQQYAPPPFPPPSQQYAPPAGPPSSLYAPPAGPPPFKAQPETAPPIYHDWQSAVPDTSLLPPPPSMGYDRSDTNNATEADAARANQWVAQRPLIQPLHLLPESLSALNAGAIELMRPSQFHGTVSSTKPGIWTVKSKRGSPDSCLMSTIPLYSVLNHNPLTTRQKKTIYFEVRILPSSRSEVSLALGFVAQPYPPFRLPGWERGSLGVHGDDGHKYVNDSWGGKDFTMPFKRGDVVGLGMVFQERQVQAPAYHDGGYQAPNQQQQNPIDVEVFFTRNGSKAGGWNLHEEADATQDRPVTGLEGWHDLCAAVGTFEMVEAEVRFKEEEWLYRP